MISQMILTSGYLIIIILVMTVRSKMCTYKLNFLTHAREPLTFTCVSRKASGSSSLGNRPYLERTEERNFL